MMLLIHWLCDCFDTSEWRNDAKQNPKTPFWVILGQTLPLTVFTVFCDC